MGEQKDSVRDQMLRVASSLFYRRGINNVGINEIISRSGVAKMSLYNHFGSKSALVEAFLRQERERSRGWLKAATGEAGTPEGRILAVFDALEGWFGRPGFRGSPFINAAVEIPNPENPARELCREHWQELQRCLRGLAEQARVGDPEELSSQLVMLLQGAIIAALFEDGPEAARHARRAAETLLRDS